MVFVLSFILEFIGLFSTLFRSFSLTNVNIPFIENFTISKRSSAFFVSFFTQNITHFIFHFIKLSQQKKGENTVLLGCNRSSFTSQSQSFFALKRLIIRLYLCFRGKKNVLLYSTIHYFIIIYK